MRAPPEALLNSPAGWIERATKLPDQLVSASINNKAIRRYLGLADELLERVKPAPACAIRTTLLHRSVMARAYSCSPSRANRSEFLSHLIAKNFPKSWLQCLGNDVEVPRTEKIFSWFDRIDGNYACLPIWPYLLLAGAVYNDFDTMIHEWMKASTQKKIHGAKSAMVFEERRFQPSQISA
jgi:hypothetical protein